VWSTCVVCNVLWSGRLICSLAGSTRSPRTPGRGPSSVRASAGATSTPGFSGSRQPEDPKPRASRALHRCGGADRGNAPGGPGPGDPGGGPPSPGGPDGIRNVPGVRRASRGAAGGAGGTGPGSVIRLPPRAFAASGGCCLPHLAALLHALPDVGTARFVLDATAAQLRRLREELETYETEAERRTRRYGSAADAPARAMVRWAGMRGSSRARMARGRRRSCPPGG